MPQHPCRIPPPRRVPLLAALTALTPRVLAAAVALAAVGLVVVAAVGAAAPGASVGAARADQPRGHWPLHPRPRVVRTFDPPVSDWLPGHRGVDLAGRPGQPVRSALAGRVSFGGRVAGVPVVVVDHGSTRTTYQPVRTSVPVGSRVAAGQQVGTLHPFGSHCLPAACLHWGWRDAVGYRDPLALVGGAPRPVRLLPPDGAAWHEPVPGRSRGPGPVPQVPQPPIPFVPPGAARAEPPPWTPVPIG